MVDTHIHWSRVDAAFRYGDALGSDVIHRLSIYSLYMLSLSFSAHVTQQQQRIKTGRQ